MFTFPEFQTDGLGILLLHGFTSHVKSVNGLLPYLQQINLQYAMPILKGHGTRFQDLKGVGWEDWVADAEAALAQLCAEGKKVIVVGLSMGGLVTLELGMRHPDKIAGAVTVAAALKFSNPLAFLTPLIAKMIPYWPAQKSFNDPNCAKENGNYAWFPTDAFASLYEFSKRIEKNLSQFHTPLLVIHSKRDQVIKPHSAETIFSRVCSEYKEIQWFEKSGHDMMQDCEKERVFAAILDFIRKFLKAP